MVQIYRDLCRQAGVLSRFSRHINIDPMEVARAEDERRLAREEPNEICNKKLEDLEKKQLDELTLLLNSTLKNLSYTRMDRFFQDAVDLEMYPSETIEERTERRRVEQKEKREQIEQEKLTCPHCSKGFASRLGLNYHVGKKVCQKKKAANEAKEKKQVAKERRKQKSRLATGLDPVVRRELDPVARRVVEDALAVAAEKKRKVPFDPFVVGGRIVLSTAHNQRNG